MSEPGHRPRPRPRVRQAVILVGGKGTRLGALTQAVPKPLMQIDEDRLFLDLLIDNVARQGFDRILLLAGYLGEQIAARYDGRTVRGAALRVLIEPEPMGTGGALRLAASALDDRFLLANGDTYFDMNYRALEQALESQDGALGAIALRRAADAARYGSVSLDDAGLVRSFREKVVQENPSPGLINAGVYLLSRAIVDHLPSGASSLEQDVFPVVAREGGLAGVEASGYFIDIGLPETLARARVDLPGTIRRPAVFLDRDGVLNWDHGYVHCWDEYDWIDGARDVVRAFNDAGYFVFVVTNQAGVAHGHYREDAVHTLHGEVQDALAAEGAFVDGFFHCPYHPAARIAAYRAIDHPDRKPAPGMILRAFNEWPIDRARSFLVGDRATDIDAAEAAGIAGLLFPGGSLYEFILTNDRLPTPPEGNEIP